MAQQWDSLAMLTIRPEQAKDIERISRLTWHNTS